MGEAGKLSKQEEPATGGSDAHIEMVGILFWMSADATAPSGSGKLVAFKNTLHPKHHVWAGEKLAKLICAQEIKAPVLQRGEPGIFFLFN